MFKKFKEFFEMSDRTADLRRDSWKGKVGQLRTGLREGASEFVHYSCVRPHHALVAATYVGVKGLSVPMAHWRPIENDTRLSLVAKGAAGTSLLDTVTTLATVVRADGVRMLGRYSGDHHHFVTEMEMALAEMQWLCRCLTRISGK